MMLDYLTYAVLALLVIVFLTQAIRILREYERGVVFMLGRFWKVKGPGLVLLIPAVQQMVKVDLRTVVFEVPTQDVISRDNVSVKVSAVVYLRVIDAEKAIIQVENYLNATSQLAQTTLRSVLGKHEHAAAVFQQAIRDLPPAYRRDRGVYLAREALAHAGAHDPEQAAAAGLQALAIAEETGSGRIIYELATLDDGLTRWATVPAVSEFREALTSFIPRETLSASRTRT